MPDETDLAATGKERVRMERRKDGRVVHVPPGAVEFRKALGYAAKAEPKSKTTKEA